MNIILKTDSYKLNHWNQYPHDTEGVYSYLESRAGATFPYTVFFGLQYVLKRYLEGEVVTGDDVAEAADLARSHFGRDDYFNQAGWARIVDEHGGRLPVRIKAVAEGTPVPTGNVLMTVENTDPECYWLTNAIESLLTHVWYPSTVATLSRSTKELIKHYLDKTAETSTTLSFMLHDFGYRGASSDETAAIGGAGHLVNFMGTDTVPAIELVNQYYGSTGVVGLSVAATEHSVMTARGESGEFDVVDQLLDEYPTGILSVVADSYDVYAFVRKICSTYRRRILDRDGVFVVRPDSVTAAHPSPAALTRWIVYTLWQSFGGDQNSKGHIVLDPHVRVLWGDGIDPSGVRSILDEVTHGGFSAENLVFGMGGGLLQKIDRDTQRFAFKASAVKRGGLWHDVYKRPLDESKASKRGRLRLERRTDGELRTQSAITAHALADGSVKYRPDLLETVFENGEIVKSYTFDQVRQNAVL